MAITKATPIVTPSFGTWWIKNLALYKISDTNVTLRLEFVPFNGTNALATTPSKYTFNAVDKAASDPTFATILNALYTELQRQYSLKNGNPTINTFVVSSLTVRASDPERPTMAFAQVTVNGSDKTLLISDVFGLAGTDMAFAIVLNNVMNEFGRQAKLAGKID